MKYLLIAMLGITTAFAQSEPVTRIKGDKDTSYKISPNLQVPNKQATKINSTTVRIETGNGNMLPDPSFESGVVAANGLPTNVGGMTVDCGGLGTKAIVTNAISNDGTKVLKLNYGNGSGLNTGRCEIWYKIPTNLIGTSIEISFTGSVKNESYLCPKNYDSGTFDSVDLPCKGYFDTDGTKNNNYVFSLIPKYDVVGLGFYRPNGSSDTSTVRESLLDTLHIGKPKSDEAIVAKFDNTTGWVDSGYIASDFTSLGTVTDIKLKSKREKDKLRIMGSFLAGTGTGTLATFKIKFNGVYLSTPSLFDTSSAPMLAGDYFRIVTADNDPNKGGKLLISSGSSTVNFSRPILYGAGAGMPNVFETGSNISPASRVVFIDATIPIAEWSAQTNAAIVACKEGPLKCTNTYTAFVSSAGAITRTTVDNWISCAWAGSAFSCTFNSGMGLTVAPSCFVAMATAASTSATIFTSVGETTTGTSVYTYDGGNAARAFKITCTKQGSDYNEAYERIVIQKDDADIRSTEWLTGGYDYISNKPIYKRCHKVASDISVDGSAITTWASGLNSLNTISAGATSNLWTILNGTTNGAFSGIRYNSTTGQVVVHLTGGSLIMAGTTFCMEYVK